MVLIYISLTVDFQYVCSCVLPIFCLFVPFFTVEFDNSSYLLYTSLLVTWFADFFSSLWLTLILDSFALSGSHSRLLHCGSL